MVQQDSSLRTIQTDFQTDSALTTGKDAPVTDSGRKTVDSAGLSAVPKTVPADSFKILPKKPAQAVQTIPQFQEFQTARETELLIEKPGEVISPYVQNKIDTAQTTAIVDENEFIPPTILRTKNSSAWEITSLLICVLLVATAKALNKKRFNLLIKSFFNGRVVPLHLREENAFSNQVIIVLTGTFVLVIALVIYQSLKFWIPGTIEDSFRFYAQICLFIVLVYIAKFSILELIAEIIDKYPAIQEYIFNVLLFNSILSLVLLPLVLGNALMLHSNNFFVITGLTFIGVTYLYRNWRAIKISFAYRFPVYYIFLYLCTLEILPSIVLIKLFQTQLT